MSTTMHDTADDELGCAPGYESGLAMHIRDFFTAAAYAVDDGTNPKGSYAARSAEEIIGAIKWRMIVINTPDDAPDPW